MAYERQVKTAATNCTCVVSPELPEVESQSRCSSKHLCTMSASSVKSGSQWQGCCVRVRNLYECTMAAVGQREA